MKRLSILFMVFSFLVVMAKTYAGDVEFISTDEARKQGTLQSDAPSVDDPYMKRAPTERDYKGHPLTQSSYEDCKTDVCKRAEKRQTTEGTTWRDDVQSGLKKGGY